MSVRLSPEVLNRLVQMGAPRNFQDIKPGSRVAVTKLYDYDGTGAELKRSLSKPILVKALPEKHWALTRSGKVFGMWVSLPIELVGRMHSSFGNDLDCYAFITQDSFSSPAEEL
jgi:hypothetical protein